MVTVFGVKAYSDDGIEAGIRGFISYDYYMPGDIVKELPGSFYGGWTVVSCSLLWADNHIRPAFGYEHDLKGW